MLVTVLTFIEIISGVVTIILALISMITLPLISMLSKAATIKFLTGA